MQRTLLLSGLSAFLCAAAAAQGTTPDPQEPTFVHEFGTPGETGSFRIRFSALGAGVMFAQTMDHFVSVRAARRGEHGPDDYMLLVWGGDNHSFRVAADPRSPSLGVDLQRAPWRYEAVAAGEVRFWIDLAGELRLHKTFRHRPGKRGLSVELAVENRGTANGGGELFLDLGGPALLNQVESSLFGNPAVAIGVGPEGPTAPVHPTVGQRQPLMVLGGGGFAMAGSTNRFFGGFLFPLDEASSRAVLDVDVVSLPGALDSGSGIIASAMPRAELGLRLAVPGPGERSAVSFGVYLGPKSFRVFDEDPEFARFLPIMDIDLDPPCCGITVPGGRFMASLLLRLLGWFDDVVGNWGIAIMMLTILVRGLLAPLNFRMQKSMREYGKRMAVLKPKLDELQKRFGNDKQAYQQAMLQFQREHKLLPPLGGCLPIFLTMPVYIGLFTALRTAYDLRQQAFLFITDLSQPDRLFDLPFWPDNFNILPLLWIGLFFFMQRKMPLPTDPQQRQMQQMMRYMPMVFGVLLYNYAAGLMVYMVTSMLWTYGESAIIRRILGPLDPAVAGMAPAPVM